MSPVFRRESEYTFKIYSNEEERMHIHVIHNGQEAKYWLEPHVELAKNTGISEHELSKIKKLASHGDRHSVMLELRPYKRSICSRDTHFCCKDTNFLGKIAE